MKFTTNHCNLKSLGRMLLIVGLSSSIQFSDAFAMKSKGNSSTGSNTKREPWDIFRFIGQSSKFVSTPKIPILIGSNSPKSILTVNPGDTLYNPIMTTSKNNAQTKFSPLDDVVMGGVSSSTFDNKNGIWKGTVSDNNSGGFIGIRTLPFTNYESWDMTSCEGIEITIRDLTPKAASLKTKRLKAVIRDSTEFNGVCWTTSFDLKTGAGGSKLPSLPFLFGGGSSKSSSSSSSQQATGGNTMTVRIPFNKQVPTIFANIVSGKNFRKDNVVGLQLNYSKFEYEGELNPNFEVGYFEIQVIEIKAY